MSSRPLASRGRVLTASVVVAAALCLAPAGAASAVVQAPAAAPVVSAAIPGSPSAVLAATAWETTGAVDQDGEPVALTDPAVANFVGWAYYDADGAFRIYNLDDSPKMQGDWEVAADGSTRTIVAKDASGAVLFTRVVPITVLTDSEFTYRVIPDAANPGVYYDIVHTPTDHAEPTAPVDETEDAVEAGAGELATTGAEAPIGVIAAALAAIAASGAALWFRIRRGARRAR